MQFTDDQPLLGEVGGPQPQDHTQMPATAAKSDHLMTSAAAPLHWPRSSRRLQSMQSVAKGATLSLSSPMDLPHLSHAP